jgi:hypothetical protein
MVGIRCGRPWCALLWLGSLFPPTAPAGVDAWFGRWMLQQAQQAPWDAGDSGPRALPPRRALELGAAIARVPGLPDCGDPRYALLQSSPEGLFQGGLDGHGRAAASARALGFAEGAVPGLRIDCANSTLDLHRLDDQTLVYALDNVLYTASRSPGALADDDDPEAAAQALLVAHLAGDMGFTEALWAAKAARLSPALAASLRGYFAAPWQDAVPPINGDPLTDSQEYPTRFAVGAAAVDGQRASVPVQFADGWQAWRVSLELVAENGGWKLDEVRGRDGSGLRTLLAERP